MSKTTLHVHHAFLYISLLSLHNNDVKWPHFKSDLSTGTARRQILPSLSEPRAWPPLFSSNKNSLLLSNRVNSEARERLKGCEVYFSATFSWTLSLSDRIVANFVISRRMQFSWVLGQLRNFQKSVMHVQSCCFSDWPHCFFHVPVAVAVIL